MSELPLDIPVQTTWTQLKGKADCRRDPSAGPGTCAYWWDSCIADKDAASKRGCFAHWAQQLNGLGLVSSDVTKTSCKAVANHA